MGRNNLNNLGIQSCVKRNFGEAFKNDGHMMLSPVMVTGDHFFYKNVGKWIIDDNDKQLLDVVNNVILFIPYHGSYS